MKSRRGNACIEITANSRDGTQRIDEKPFFTKMHEQNVRLQCFIKNIYFFNFS